MHLGKNIYDLRKQRGLSQEKLAEQIHVTRQTISNWELGTTAPNPEQLLLLSRALNKSIDELLDNEIPTETVSEKGEYTEVKHIYAALALLCGLIAGVWSFSANRFRYIEMLWIILAGMAMGICIGAVCHGILKYLKYGRYQGNKK